MTTETEITQIIEDIQATRGMLSPYPGNIMVLSVLDRCAKTILALHGERAGLSKVLQSLMRAEKDKGMGRRSDWNKPAPGRAGNNRTRPKKNAGHTRKRGV